MSSPLFRMLLELLLNMCLDIAVCDVISPITLHCSPPSQTDTSLPPADLRPVNRPLLEPRSTPRSYRLKLHDPTLPTRWKEINPQRLLQPAPVGRCQIQSQHLQKSKTCLKKTMCLSKLPSKRHQHHRWLKRPRRMLPAASRLTP